MKLLIATKNRGKYGEIVEVLQSLPLEIYSLAELGLNDEVEEHGTTHEANAILKARFFYEKTGLPTVGEDSGIHVDAFPGDFGVQTRRWRGLGQATDEEWIEKFLQEMAGLPDEKRGAKFVSCAAFIFDVASLEKPHIFNGETRGVITATLEAPLKPGIPISSCFRPDGAEKVYAALSQNEKNKISHRGKAMHELAAFLKNNLL